MHLPSIHTSLKPLHLALIPLVLAAAILAAGCSTTGPATGENGPDDNRSETSRLLDDQAAAESAADEPAELRDLPPAPGLVEPFIAPITDPDSPAAMPLDEVLATHQRNRSNRLDVDARADPVDPEQRDLALRHYFRGRDLLLRQRSLQAVTELEKAAEADPHSTAIKRELARSYAALGNSNRAIEQYRAVLERDPDDDEALLAIGLTAIERGELEEALAHLGAKRLAGERFRNDPAAHIVADFALEAALRRAGYIRAANAVAEDVVEAIASIEITASMYARQLESISEQRNRLYRSLGDGRLRLGQPRAALSAYGTALALPTSGDQPMNDWLIAARMIYTNLLLDRPASAQRVLVKLLQHDPKHVPDLAVRLALYLQQWTDDAALLQQSVRELQQQHPHQEHLLRTLAALVQPAARIALLERYVDHHQRGFAAMQDLFADAAANDPAAAADLATKYTSRAPHLAAKIAERLLVSTGEPMRIVEAMGERVDSPAAMTLHARLLMLHSDLGGAWWIVDRGLQRWPDDLGLREAQIEIAAVMNEPALLEQVELELQPGSPRSTQLLLSQANRSLGNIEPAIAIAQSLLEENADDYEAMLELGRNHLARAEQDPEQAAVHQRDARHYALETISQVQHAIAADRSAPDRRGGSSRDAIYIPPADRQRLVEQASEILFAITQPGSESEDPALLRETIANLAQMYPGSTLLRRIQIEASAGRGRSNQAVEHAIDIYLSDRADTAALALAINIWASTARAADALHWLEDQMRDRPGDPYLLDERVRLLLRMQRSTEALALLESQVESEHRTPAAARLLEEVHRQLGRHDHALALAQQRLEQRPPAPGRQIELARVHVAAGQPGEAIDLLAQLPEMDLRCTTSQYAAALQLLGRMPDQPRRDETLLALLDAAEPADVRPALPLQVYGHGLLALARQGMTGERFDELATRAARSTAGRDTTPQLRRDMLIYRELANALVQSGDPMLAARTLQPVLIQRSDLPQQVVGLYARMVVPAHAASGGQARTTIELLQQLDMEGRLPDALLFSNDASLASLLSQAAHIYTLLDDEDGAAELYRAVLEINPDDAMTLNNLGYMQLEHGRVTDETIRMIERAFALSPDDPSILDTIGWLRYLQGRFSDQPGARDDPSQRGALRLLNDAADNMTEPSAEVFDHLGDVLWRLGEEQLALENWREAIELLEDPERRRRMLENYQALQQQVWGIVVAEPRQIDDRQVGSRLRQLQQKVQAAEAGHPPPVQPTLNEIGNQRTRER